MLNTTKEIPDYLESLPAERKQAMTQLRKTMVEKLPAGFIEIISYGMISYAVPHSIYPAGYHCDPKQPLPFLSIASQKNFIAVYHMGLYADPEMLKWFLAEYEKEAGGKPDMGKSCIRFKKPEKIPFALIGELVSRMSVQQWIALYEQNLKPAKNSA